MSIQKGAHKGSTTSWYPANEDQRHKALGFNGIVHEIGRTYKEGNDNETEKDGRIEMPWTTAPNGEREFLLLHGEILL